jgi:hypothetical protein
MRSIYAPTLFVISGKVALEMSSRVSLSFHPNLFYNTLNSECNRPGSTRSDIGDAMYKLLAGLLSLFRNKTIYIC